MGILEDVMKALDRMPNWKRMQAGPKELDALALRVKAIEDALSLASGTKCPKCSAMAYKLTHSAPAPHPCGRMGARQDHYACNACNYTDVQDRNPG